MVLYKYNKYVANATTLWAYTTTNYSTGRQYEVYPSFSFNTSTGVFTLSGTPWHMPDTWNGVPGYYKFTDGKVFYITYSRESNVGDGDPTNNEEYSSGQLYTPYSYIVYSRGTLITSNIEAVDGTYPVDGRHTDGYWYVRGVAITYMDSGTVEKIITTANSARLGRLSWVATTSSGGTVSMQVCYSGDGATWTAWESISNGGILTSALAYVKYKATLTPSADKYYTPQLNEVKLTYPTTYYATGSWTSNVIDLRSYEGGITDISSSITKTGTEDIKIYIRNSIDNVNWSDWELVGTSLPVDVLYIQYKIDFTAGAYQETTPELVSLTTSILGYTPRAIWTSNIVDVSNAISLLNGKLITATQLNNGRIDIESQSSADRGTTWSEWSTVGVDGTVTHPLGDYIRIRYTLTDDSLITEATLSMDGQSEATILEEGLVAYSSYDFTTLRDKLIITNGIDSLRMWDGVTATPTVIAGTTPKLRMLTTHHNRVWGVDTENKSRVRYSDILDPETWGAFSFIDFNPEDGDEITAIMRYGQYLVVSKQRSMAILTGNQVSNYSVTWLDSEVGVTGKDALVSADKYLVYVAQDGIRFTDLSTSVVATERMLPDWRGLNLRRLNQASIVYWRNCIYVTLPKAGSLVNNVVWCYDFLRNSWSIYEGWSISHWIQFKQYGEDVLLGADSTTGQVYAMLESSYDDEEQVDYTWKSKDFNFEHPERYKLFRSIYLDIEGITETSTIEATMLVDGEEKGTYIAHIPAGKEVKHTRRILPPLYDAVLGRTLTLKIKTRCGIQGISIEYVIRGAVPGGEL